MVLWMRYLKDVASLRLDAAKCTGCGTCLEVCPHGVLERDGAKVRIADLDACMECGACALNCPPKALTVASGVGCAQAIVRGALTGNETCGCGGDGKDGKKECC